MTEHEKAIESALNFECKKDGMRQSQSGDWKLTLTVQAQDMPTEVLTALMGDRFMAVLVAIDTDEQPIKIEAKKPTNNNIAQAAMLVKDPEYQEYLSFRYREILRGYDGHVEAVFKCILDIRSKKEVTSGAAAEAFKGHVADFNAWKRGEI